jgi:hypothetical protein
MSLSKNSSSEMDPCNEIWWFIDCLGAQDLLEPLIQEFNRESRVSIKDGRRSDIWKSHLNGHQLIRNCCDDSLFNGIYFTGAHWHFIKNGIDGDSYTLNYQVDKTCHFCQTFALICFLDESEFVAKDYVENVVKCVNWWRSKFDESEFVRFELMKQIRNTFDNNSVAFDYITGKPLNKFTEADLQYVFTYIIKNAKKISTCR